MRSLSLVLLSALVLTTGCAVTSASPGTQSGTDRDRITREQLEAIPPTTVFEAVKRYHQEWLRGRSATVRSTTGRTYPQVFVDGRPYGPLDSLHGFVTESVESIRFISATDATTRYGTGYPAGIIEIITRGE